ncbi:DUF2975 domain-containing protein [Erythrobacter arachoides]|uniref:DUF2975 domain-containing protein n=1 Tax=Aurantiacibacter arachoides TaxID=1850444 RepID=A0A845A3D6_9SPHN|nr:DUF2975 domain-containing protein [Aurantiacibacter arachoides]MXO94438.1 DUF2975 domain-containing protein [Aurantiacibacter arachoides]GGD63406.1 hypothetical protein GCM10011411_24690 [Aurantiacibacter arachoides]
MALTPKDPLLSAARVIIVLFQALVAFGSGALVVGIPILLAVQDPLTERMRAETARADFIFPLLPVIGMMALFALVLVIGFLFLRHLRRIVDTVGQGDPFVPENADRLTAMAWLVVGAQVIAIPAIMLLIHIQQAFEETNPSTDAAFDFGGILLALTLFILARVFRQGTAMREDLEGTV